MAAILLVSCNGNATATPTVVTVADTPIPTATILPSLTPTPTITPVPVSGICSPFSRHSLADLSSMVSWPFDPEAGVGHYGLDLAHWKLNDEVSTLDDPVQAIMDGRVAGFVIDRPPSGTMIVIETTYAQIPPALVGSLNIPAGYSIYHQYAHLADSPDLQIGQSILCGQYLDRVGLTGWSVSAHLHLETRQGPAGFTFTTMAFYTADASPEEMANYHTWFIDGQYQAFDPMIILAQGLP